MQTKLLLMLIIAAVVLAGCKSKTMEQPENIQIEQVADKSEETQKEPVNVKPTIQTKQEVMDKIPTPPPLPEDQK